MAPSWRSEPPPKVVEEEERLKALGRLPAVLAEAVAEGARRELNEVHPDVGLPEHPGQHPARLAGLEVVGVRHQIDVDAVRETRLGEQFLRERRIVFVLVGELGGDRVALVDSCVLGGGLPDGKLGLFRGRTYIHHRGRQRARDQDPRRACRALAALLYPVLSAAPHPRLTTGGRERINPLTFLAIARCASQRSEAPLIPGPIQLPSVFLQMRVESGTRHDAYVRPMGRRILAEGSSFT